MSSHNRATWAAEEQQARAIVNALNAAGAGIPQAASWALEDGSGTPDEWHAWQLRRQSDDLRIGLAWPDYPRSTQGRITASLIWPSEGNGRRVVRTPYGQPEPITAISMAASKPAAQLAKEILSRLVLKDAARLHVEALRLIAAAQESTRTMDQTVARILDASPGAHVSPNSGPHVVYLGRQSEGYTVRVDGANSVRFEAFSVNLPAALKILEALRRDPVCEACGKEITEAQAGLSRARAEGAPAWCPDCVTEDLTARAAHREADPHCTCPDCIGELIRS